MVIRKCALAIAFIFAILLSGCSDEEKEIPKPKYFDLDEVQEFPIKDFKEVDMAETRLNAVIYDITLPKGSSSNTYCMYGKDIYYAVDYPDPMQIGEEFKKENSASIWRYSIDTKKSELIYQCNYEYWVGIDSIKCNGNILIWSEYSYIDGGKVYWRDIKNTDSSKIIFMDDKNASFATFNPVFAGEDVYWFGENKLNRYDFEEGSILTEEDNLSLSSKFQRLYINESMYGMCKLNENGRYDLIIRNMETETEEVIEISEVPDNIVCNSRYCAWFIESFTGNKNFIYIYNYEYQQMMKINVGGASSFILIDNLLIVNGESVVTAYNIDTKEKTKVVLDTTGDIFLGSDNNVYGKWYNRQEAVLSILNITTGDKNKIPEVEDETTAKPKDNPNYDTDIINITEWEEYIVDPNDRYKTTMFRPKKIVVRGVEYVYTYNSKLAAITGSDGTDIKLEYSTGDEHYIIEHKNGKTVKYLEYTPYFSNPTGYVAYAFEYEGKRYTYVFDILDRIRDILDEDGNKVASYKYTSLEKGTSIEVTNYTDDNIGDVNSIRYKGYYVDAATGFAFYHKNIYNVINLNDVNLIEMFDPMS